MALPLDNAGIVLPADLSPEYYPDVFWFMQQYFVDQYPLMTRTTRLPIGTQNFKVRHTKYRPRLIPVGSAMEATATGSTVSVASTLYTTLTLANQPNRQTGLADSTSLMNGDVLEFVTAGGAVERVEVIATPTTEVAALPKLPAGIAIPAIGTVIVRRGAEGTTVVAHATSDGNGTLVSNSRTGGEVFQSGIRAHPIEQNQWVQNWMYPVQISGAVDSTTGYGLQPGGQFNVNKVQQLDNMLRDMERSSWYGIGEAPLYDGGGNPLENRLKQTGVKYQIGANLITPSNPNAYTSQMFLTDVFIPLWEVGSQPDVMFVGALFLAGLSAWSKTFERIDVGQNALGLDIQTFRSNLAPNVEVIPCQSLNPGDAFIGMSEFLFWRAKRGEFFKPRGSRGDAIEGDWIAEGAIELRDQEKHAFISGLVTFSA